MFWIRPVTSIFVANLATATNSRWSNPEHVASFKVPDSTDGKNPGTEVRKMIQDKIKVHGDCDRYSLEDRAMDGESPILTARLKV